MKISKGKVVSIHYTLKNDDGEVLESSEGASPLCYLHGVQGIVAGLEKALEGKESGEKLAVTVPPEEGYGPHKDELVQDVPRDSFPDVEKVEPGMAFEADTEDGSSHRVVVTNVSDENVTVDGNHPLAGRALNFSVEITDIREASDEELANGEADQIGRQAQPNC